ncbi:zinc finger protein 576, tandem duplicate 1 [Stigmatopora argus]
MLNPAQEESVANPAKTSSLLEPLDNHSGSTKPAPSEASAQEDGNKSFKENNGTRTDKTLAVTLLEQAVGMVEPSKIIEEMEVDQGPKPNPPSELTPNATRNPGTKEQESKKMDRYFPSKKAMTDPLKMDMTKPLVMPLTSSELSLQCLECHIIFSDFKSKRRHLKLNHPAEYEECMLRNCLFTCYHCDRQFTNSAELLAHQKTHIERKPYKCPLCGQAFKKLSELTRHQKIHIGLNGYTCPDCGKTCKTMTLLKYHTRVHTGERPYVCKECGNRFRMSQALKKHMQFHLPESEQKEGQAKAQRKKELDALKPKYPCSICKATFKSPKTRLHHFTKKHSVSLTSLGNTLQVKSYPNALTPVITPISIPQSSLLQLEPDGPLKKVDSNIDTEPIRRLIESLGNVQKVQQVVILGQVPPYALPLEVQHVSELSKPANHNINIIPPQLDSVNLMPVELKTLDKDLDDPMLQTITLEPITPDGQLINPPLSNLDTHELPGESLTFSFVPTGLSSDSEERVMDQTQPQLGSLETNSDVFEPSIFHNKETDLKQDLDQNIVLELTPALTPSAELQQLQNAQQPESPSPSLVPTTELEKTTYQSNVNEPDIGSPTPSFEPTVEQSLTSLQSEIPLLEPDLVDDPTSLQTKHEDLACSALASPHAPTHNLGEAEANSQEKAHSQTQKASHVHVDLSSNSGSSQQSQDEPTEDKEVDRKEENNQVDCISSKNEGPSQSSIQQEPQTSELPVNVMSAQELVKVRKRKPARAFIIQGYMQELIGSILDKDLQGVAKQAKRKRSNKSNLVNFSPQKKVNNNKKQKLSSQQCQPSRGKPIFDGATKRFKGKMPSKKGNISSKSNKKKKMASSGKVNKLQLINNSPGKDKVSKKKMKKELMKRDQHKTKQKAAIKKKIQTKAVQKSQPKKTKVSNKGQKDSKSPKSNQSKVPPQSPTTQVTQDSLLLLKGHKQPQLKVYKLDPSKTSGQETSPRDNQCQHGQANQAKSKNKTTNSASKVAKKKGKAKKSQKALTLLSLFKASQQSAEPQLVKPKTARKRKASSNVETEGVITSAHSKRALECKNCGEIFSEVASLQKHKAMVHILESPELTYTNGNVFEGVSRLDVNHQERAVRLINPTTGWDVEPDVTVENREINVSFPALIPSPSLPSFDEGSVQRPVPPKPFDSMRMNISKLNPLFSSATQMEVSRDKQQEKCLPGSLRLESEHQAPIENDFKEDGIFAVDLVTVGEYNTSLASLSSPQETLTQSGSVKVPRSGAGTAEKTSDHSAVRFLHSVSCSTRQMEFKDEEEEMLVQKRKEAAKHGQRQGGTPQKVDTIARESLPDSVAGTDLEIEEDCQVVYKKIDYTSQINDEDEIIAQTSLADTHHKPHAQGPTSPATIITPTPSTLDEANVSQGDQENRQSPGIYLEKIIAGEPVLANRQSQLITSHINKRQGLNSTLESETQQLIKLEENTSDARLDEGLPEKEQQRQTNRDVRRILVKRESRLVLDDARPIPESRHGQLDAEQVIDQNAAIPLTDNEETSSDTPTSPGLTNKQCIFYPVKTEEWELPLGGSRINRGRPEEFPDDGQTLDSTKGRQSYEGTQEGYHDLRGSEMVGVHDLTDRQDEAEFHNPPDTRSFLLQTSDEEDTQVLELSPPHVDAEAEVLDYFCKHQDHCSSSSVTSQFVTNQAAARETKEPIEYFSKYFGWDTWVEMARCSNQTSNCVTAKDVAQFVGIHIAMGTLKFPSPRLYWDNLTKVPLVAEAMPFSRFLQLSRSLRLAPPNARPLNGQMRRQRRTDFSHRPNNRSDQSGLSNDCMDPLWKVVPLLCHFQKRCPSLRRQGDFAVDQYLIPLTGQRHNNRLALHSTTLIGFDGLLHHVDLKVDLADKEDAVEKMVPKGSTVFLCKQELSTPAMLERLLGAGIHGAGRVGGAQGQIGDEFVSSDGKLMLRKSRQGFILSTAGNGQRNMASLMSNFEKAQAAARLSKDLLNLYPIPVSNSPAGWILSVLWYLTDMALVNSWLLYRQFQTAASATLSLLDFRLSVAKALIDASGSDPQNSVVPQNSPAKAHSLTDSPNPGTVEENPLPDAATRYDGSGHWPEQLGEGEGGRCRFGDCQRTSRVLCLKCCVFLCISRNHNCFLNFHSQASPGNL